MKSRQEIPNLLPVPMSLKGEGGNRMKTLILCPKPELIERVALEILSGVKKAITTNMKSLEHATGNITYTEEFPLEAECVFWVNFPMTKRLEYRVNDIQADLFLFPTDLQSVWKYKLPDVKIFEVKENELPEEKTAEEALRLRSELTSSNGMFAK